MSVLTWSPTLGLAKQSLLVRKLDSTSLSRSKKKKKNYLFSTNFVVSSPGKYLNFVNQPDK